MPLTSPCLPAARTRLNEPMNFTPRTAVRTQETPGQPRLCSYCIWVIGLSVVLSGIGCASQSGPELTFRPDAARQELEGDWDDIDAAVLAGTNRTEWVVSRWWWSDDSTRNYDLRNAHGTSGSVRIRRASDGGGAAALELTASIGPFGDAAAERELIAAIDRRLQQLRGVDAAEIR